MDVHLFGNLHDSLLLQQCRKHRLRHSAAEYLPEHHEISASTWACVAYVIVGGTFLAYILMMIGQKTLRPTVISMYNYVQPIVGTSVSILLGMGTFGVAKGIAVALVFTGVYIVTQSKSREQMLAEQAAKKE